MDGFLWWDLSGYVWRLVVECRRFGVGLGLGPYDLHIPGCMWLSLCCVSYNVLVHVIVGEANGLCGFWLG